MKCDECGNCMVIDEWNGWIWTCFHCDNIGRPATSDEVKEQEKYIINRCGGKTVGINRKGER